jgi:hypothetical protein
MYHAKERSEKHTKFSKDNLKKRDHKEDLNVYGIIILK